MKRIVATLVAVMMMASTVYARGNCCGNGGGYANGYASGYSNSNVNASPSYSAITQDDINVYVAQRKAMLDEKVLEGVITQESADSALASYKAKLERCMEYGGYCGLGPCGGTGYGRACGW